MKVFIYIKRKLALWNVTICRSSRWFALFYLECVSTYISWRTYIRKQKRSPGFSDALRVAFYVFHLIKRPLVAYICNVHLVALSKSQIRNLVASHHQIRAFEYKSDILESKNVGRGDY